MNYEEAMEFISYTNRLGSVLGLASISRLLDQLGNPEKELKFIHIGGTNGKGSTSNFIGNILLEANYRVGLFTSPHMVRFNESIVFNGGEIPDEDFSRLIGLIKSKGAILLDQGYNHPTTFEVLTALGFLYFKEKNADFVVLEVGLGGENDSTNIIPPPLASLITTIDYDHIDILGSTIEEIARVKAGIIKEDSLVVSYMQRPSVHQLLEGRAKEKNSKFYILKEEDVRIKEVSNQGSVFDFSFRGTRIDDLEIGLIGQYQVYNACLAIMLVLVLKENQLLNIGLESIKRGLKKTRWPGRFEVLGERPTIVVDGSHNLQGIIQLGNNLKYFKYDRLILCMAILKDKDVAHMVEAIAPLSHKVIVTQVDSPRRLLGQDLGAIVKDYQEDYIVEEDIEKAVSLALNETKEDDLLVFCGSIYLIGQVREILKRVTE